MINTPQFMEEVNVHLIELPFDPSGYAFLVNGKSVGDPIKLDWDLTPARPQLALTLEARDPRLAFHPRAPPYEHAGIRAIE